METPQIDRKKFNRIRRHLPPQKHRKRVSDRLVLSAIFWVARTGSSWRQIPKFYGNWTTIYSRFRRWSKNGIFEKIFRIFTKQVDKNCNAMIDATYVKAHRTAASMACSDSDRKIGRSHGGLTTKLHLLCNEYGLPLDFLITGGEVHDVRAAPQIISQNRMKGLIADKAYGSKKVRKILEERKIKVCIPAKSNAKDPIPHDRILYKKRHRIENMFSRIKDWKGIALRTARCAHTFNSFVSVALITIFF